MCVCVCMIHFSPEHCIFFYWRIACIILLFYMQCISHDFKCSTGFYFMIHFCALKLHYHQRWKTFYFKLIEKLYIFAVIHFSSLHLCPSWDCYIKNYINGYFMPVPPIQFNGIYGLFYVLYRKIRFFYFSNFFSIVNSLIIPNVILFSSFFTFGMESPKGWKSYN